MPEGEERSAALMARAEIAKRKQQEKNSMPIPKPARKSTPAERGSKYTEDKAATRASNVPSAKAPTSQASSTRLPSPDTPHHHAPPGSLDQKDVSFGLQADQTKAEQRSTTQSYSPFYKLLLSPQHTDPSSPYLPPTTLSPQLSKASSQKTLRPKEDRNVRVLREGRELHETRRRSGSRGQRNSRPSAHSKTQPLVEDVGDRHLQTLKRNLRTWFYYPYGKMTGIVQANGPSVSSILSILQHPLYQVIASVYAITVSVCRFIKVLTSWYKLLGLLIFICLCGYAIDAVLSLPGFRQINTLLVILYRALGLESTSNSSTSLDQQQQTSEASMKLQGYMDQIKQLSFCSGVLYRPLPLPKRKRRETMDFRLFRFICSVFLARQLLQTTLDSRETRYRATAMRIRETAVFVAFNPWSKQARTRLRSQDQWRNSYGSIYNVSSRYTVLSECLKAESQQLADLVEAMTTRPAADLQPTKFAQWLLHLFQITTRCPRKALIMERINKLQAIMNRLHSCLAQFHGPYKMDITQDPIMIQLDLVYAVSFNYLEYYSFELPRAEQTYPLSMPQSQAATIARLNSYQADLARRLHTKVLTLTSHLLFSNSDHKSLKSLRQSLQDIKVRVGRADDSITPAKALFYEVRLAEIISEFLNSSADYWI
uniref:Uncharacterized protein n=1 Tax=Bionectria ochroleuca TaxID=29856 RepID=A0A8H7K6R7_BIOOC